jgi:hypothetical protein
LVRACQFRRRKGTEQVSVSDVVMGDSPGYGTGFLATPVP